MSWETTVLKEGLVFVFVKLPFATSGKQYLPPFQRLQRASFQDYFAISQN